MLLAVLVTLARNGLLCFVNEVFHDDFATERAVVASGSDIFQPVVK
jgi:hypothetical protein